MFLRRQASTFLAIVLTSIIGHTGASSEFPFSLGVRDSLMIAHSFHNNPRFGPAGSMHGATYTCDVEFLSKSLDPETNWVIDIGKASDILSDVLVSCDQKTCCSSFGVKLLNLHVPYC
jgi:6-pyruvoyl tetrahydropterin synthase